MTLLLTIFVIALVLIIVWPKTARKKAPDGDDAGSISTKLAGASVKMSSAGSARPTATPMATHHWTSDHFDFEVVGESFYQSQIAELVRRAGVHHAARLVLDSNNPHDNLAVRVDINGQTVGHLSRDDARSFRRRLGAMRMTGQTTTCDAEIRGGNTAKDGRALTYGVFLAMKQFG